VVASLFSDKNVVCICICNSFGRAARLLIRRPREDAGEGMPMLQQEVRASESNHLLLLVSRQPYPIGNTTSAQRQMC